MESSIDENSPTATNDVTAQPVSTSDANHPDGPLSEGEADCERGRDCDTPLMDEAPDSDGSTPIMDEPMASAETPPPPPLPPSDTDSAEAKLVSAPEAGSDSDPPSGEQASSKTGDVCVDSMKPKPIIAADINKSEESEKLSNGVASCDGKISTNIPKPSLGKSMSNESGGSQGHQICVTYNGELYTCNECGYSNKGHHFEEHLMCHLIAKPYQCLYCKEGFGTRKEIIKHLADMHTGKKLNCMLKALSRAKHLMQDAQKTNSCVFYALIPPSQHQMKKSLSSGSTASISSAKEPNKDTILLPLSSKSSTVSEDEALEPTNPESQDVVVNNRDNVDQDKVASVESKQAISSEQPSDEYCSEQPSEEKDNEQLEEKDSEQPPEEKDSEQPPEEKDSEHPSEEKDSEQSSEEQVSEQPSEEKDSERPSEEQVGEQKEKDSILEENNYDSHASSTDRESEFNVDAVADNEESVGNEGCVEAVTSHVPNSDSAVVTNEMETTKSDTLGIEKICSSESYIVDPDVNAAGPSVDPEVEDAGGIKNDADDACSVTKDICMEDSSDTTKKNITNDEDVAKEPSAGSSAQEETSAEQEPAEGEMQADNSVPEDVQCDTSLTKEKQSKEITDIIFGKEGNESDAKEESEKKDDSDKKESKETPETNFSEKAVHESENMSLKIVSSYSLDIPSDDYSEEDKQKNVGNSAISSENDDDKDSVDLSAVVIDVFKDGRISVQYSKETSPTKGGQEVEKEEDIPVVESRPHQTKLCQLLTGTAPFPTSCMVPTPATVSAHTSSVPGISQAQMKHMRNPNFYVCGLNCNFSCLNSVDFRDHLFLGHAGEKSFPCFYCGWMSHTEESLLRHITNHAHTYSKSAPLYLCGIYKCKFGTNLLSDLLNHMQILHQDIRVYICKECSETFNDVKSLVSHFEDNFIHVVNCPHCACKGTDRRMILKHIAEYHPGKAKMVSVAKQIICKDRKVNNYKKVRALYKCSGTKTSTASDEMSMDIKPSSDKLYTTLKEGLTDNQQDMVQVKIENMQGANLYGKMTSSSPSHSSKTSKDTPAEKNIKPPKCSHCTFVARDQRRLESHMKCHGLPVIKRHRFRCLYCPQGFDSSQKFKLHINCHPGLIKYWMYYCKRCDFDSNQRYVMLRHIRTRDELHMNDGNEEDMFSVVERIMESRVLECEHCNYQTRHKLHLQIHYQREHKDVNVSSQSYSVKQQVKWTPPPRQLSSSPYDSHKENASKKFKCPFCRYLVPKAADLKAHVKKHTNLGKITLDFLRCRYCSLSSTAREIVYDHIREKHRGKSLIVVRKTVTIDTSGSDNSFSETSVTEAPMIEDIGNPVGNHNVDKYQCETCSFATVDRREFAAHIQLHNTTKGGMPCMSMDDESDDDDAEEEGLTGVDHPQPNSDEDSTVKLEPEANLDHIEQVFIIPETVAGDQISTPARCCNCYYASAYRSAFIDHMNTNHPSVMIVTRNRGTAVEQSCPTGKVLFALPESLNNEVLLVPDRQVFTQAVQCPKCPSFTTYFRRNLVLHLSKDHPEITAMGKCTWPGWLKTPGISSTATSMGESKPILNVPKRSISTEKQDESCIIGSGDLDEQIACLYRNFGDRQQCLICNSVKPKKFFMHIHLLRHLNIFLVGCPYCPHKGLQKYKVGRHMKTNHPERESVVVEFNHDISRIVAEFLAHQKKVVTAAAATPSKRSSGSLLNFKPFAKFSSEKDISTTNKLSGPLGTPYLDEKLLCLYTCVEGKNKCSLCCVEFARKYAIHRHLVVNHLKVSLLKCGHCGFEGVEKHVIIDHILEQHKNQPIKFEPLDIDMEQKVQDFLNTYNVVKPEPVSTYMHSKVGISPVKSVGPQSYCLGKDKLHGKLTPLFAQKGSSFKCTLCKWKFPRKYAIHRHILMKHLKIGLYGCTHCHVQGAERYIVVAHMKEAHPKVTPQARILEVDMDRRIQEVLLEATSGTSAHSSGRKPRFDQASYEEDNSFQDFETGQDESMAEDNKSQMVVAMFGKKRKKHSSESESAPSYDNSVTPKKLKTTSRMVDVTTKIRVVCVEDGSFKKYVCEKCRFTSLHRSNVYRHVLRIHEKYREQQCPLCGYKTYSKFLLDQHIEVEHEGRPAKNSYEDMEPAETSVKVEPGLEQELERTPKAESSHKPVKHYACAYCNFETHTAETIIKHTRENHALGGGESPPSSSADFSTIDDKPASHEVFIKKTHVKRGTFTENQMLFCGYCRFKAPGVQALKDHHKANHSSSKLCIISPQPWRYICRICGLKNNAGGKMRCHINRHVEYRPYTCTSCSQAYASTDELRKHMRNLQHSDQCQYIKHEKKEQKVNRLLEESRKNALLVNVGAPPDSSTLLPGTVSRMPSTDEKLNFKEPKPSLHEPKFKGIKRTMKMPMSPSKSLKKKYWKNGLDRESKAVTKDIACHWCDTPQTVSVDQMYQHHLKEHPDREFLWLDTRQANTCNKIGRIVSTGTTTVQPSISELYSSKQLANHKMKYYCNGCPFSAWYLPAMVSHCRCHLPKKYLCAYCHLRYSNRDYLEKHQQTFHPGSNLWVLYMVEISTGDKTVPEVVAKLDIIVKKEIPMDTDEVDEAERAAAAAAPPLPSAAPSAIPSAPVDVPERRASQNVVLYCCNYCMYNSESLYQYRLHLVEHGTFKHLKTDISTDSPLKCGFCPYIATDQSDFSTHIQTHFENRSFKCAHCSYSAYTRAHVRFHCGNQHPDLVQDVVDLSSAASYVEYLKSEKTNLPKLVDLDPRVVLRDIKSMSQNDLEELMTNELKKAPRTSPGYGEDGCLDESFEDVESPTQDPAGEGTESVGVKTEAVEDQISSDDIAAAAADTSVASGEVTQAASFEVEDKMEVCEAPDASQDEVESSATSVTDGDHRELVSSSVGDPEKGVGDHFDLAEVSAFTDSESLGHPADVTFDIPNFENASSELTDDIMATTEVNASDIVNGDSSLDDEVDSNTTRNDEVAIAPKLMPIAPLVKEKSPDKEEKVKKDETANVFDTLHSWLGMK